jgi:acyl carrier protein
VTDQEITSKVIDCVAKSLALSPDVIQPDSKVIAELGADSLDFMDMIFALEQSFGIRLQKENFNLVSRLGLEQAEAVTPEGDLTSEARNRLRHWFSNIPMDGALRPADLSQYFTIQTFTVIVRDMLAAKSQAAAAGQGEAAAAAPPM